MNFLIRLVMRFFGWEPKQENALGRGYGPRKGWAWNPLKAHRNIPCPCQSGLKAKRCCGQFETLPVDVARKVNRFLKSRERSA